MHDRQRTINLEREGSIDPSDEELVNACIQGDRDCFRLLYRRHHQRVRQILYQLCDPPTIDDLVQEVFLRAWKGLPKFRRDAQFSTWLYRIAWNVCADRRQAIARDRTRLQTIKDRSNEYHEDPDVMQLYYREAIGNGLAHLSEDRRSVLVLHDLQEIPQKEVAEILGIPVGTVKSRLFYARAAMRKFLERSGISL
jgi:RNA polymerase sigma factor (sigma-70 family)